MTMPSHPFELLIYGKDGRVRMREFSSLPTAMAAALSLKPARSGGGFNAPSIYERRQTP